MSDLLTALVLGAVQGLTEFLPVSSTGHLVVLEDALNVSDDTFGLTFDAAIHLGTLTAVLIYFWPTFVTLTRTGLSSIVARRWNASEQSRLAWLIVIGTVPAGLAGLALESTVEDAFRSPALVAVMLIIFSGVLVVAERVGRGLRTLVSVMPRDALVVGIAQSIALIPGVSRSGITISAGMLGGFRRDEAARFAFLLSAPIIAAAGGKQMIDVMAGLNDGTYGGHDLALFGVGMISAAIVGLGAIAFLMRYLQRNPLYLFIAYRLGLGVLILALVGAGVL